MVRDLLVLVDRLDQRGFRVLMAVLELLVKLVLQAPLVRVD